MALALGLASALPFAQGPGGGSSRNSLFGVKMSGPQYAPWLNQAYPISADFAYLASKGTGTVRLPVAWEDLQPVLGAPLNATAVNKVLASIAAAWQNGIGTIVEVCNFGAYVAQAQWTTTVGYAGNAGNPGTGVSFLGDATLTSAAFADLWTRFATVLVGRPGLVGYGLMNEPSPNIVRTNLASPPNYFGVASGLNSNFITNGAVVTQLAAGTNPLGANYGPAWSVTSGTGFGETFVGGITYTAIPHAVSYYMNCAAGTEAANLKVDGTTASSVTVSTAPKRYVGIRTPSAGTNKSASVQVNSVSGHTIQIANMQVEANPATSTASSIAGSVLTVAGTVAGAFAVGMEVAVSNVIVAKIASLGTGSGGVGTYNLDVSPGNVTGVAINAIQPYAPNPYLPYAQAGISAIRAVDPATQINVQGIFSSKAAAWPQYNDELVQLAGGNFAFEAHQYFDGPQGVGGPGQYSGSYASYGITSSTGAQAVAPFLAWAVSRGVTPCLGEFGVTGLTDAASWLAVQGNFLTPLRAAGCKGSVWCSCATGSQPDATFNVTAIADDPRLLQVMSA